MHQTFNLGNKVQVFVGELILTPNLIVMKKFISLIKKGVKAYINQAVRSQALTPTGTIPMGI